MSNRSRRKVNRIAYKDGIGHLTTNQRILKKALNGKPVRSLTSEERRYWAQCTRYCRSTGKPVSVVGDLLSKVA